MGGTGQPATDSRLTRLTRRQSLRWRLMILLVWMFLVTLLVIGVSVFFFISQNERRAWQGRQQEAALYAGRTVAAFMQRAEDTLTLVSLLERAHLEEEPQLMRDFLEQNPALLEIIRVDKDGHVFASAYREKPLLATLFTITQSGWFLDAKAGKLYLGDIQISGVNEPYLVIAKLAPDGSVVAARLHMSLLREVVADIRFGESGQAYIVDQQGHIIAHTKPEVALARMSLAGRTEMDALAQAPNHEWRGSYHNFEQTRVVGVTAPVPGTQWVVVTELPQSEAFAVSRMALLLLGGLMALFGVLMVWVTARFFLGRLVVQPIEKLRIGTERIGSGDLAHRLDFKSGDEIEVLADNFNKMADQLQRTLADLEGRVARRTRALEASANLSRRLSTILDQEQLVSEVVEQVQAAFGYYHAHIYLVDPASGELVMAGGTGAAGWTMLAKGHRIPRDQGLVGRAARTNAVVLAPDVSQEADWLPHPLLPDTQSEIAVPIAAGERVLGVLDVQHNVVGGLGQDDADLLGSIANQVAVALQNTRLFAETRQRAEREARLNLITERIQRTTTVEDALQTAIRELGRTIGAEVTSVRLHAAQESDNGHQKRSSDQTQFYRQEKLT